MVPARSVVQPVKKKSVKAGLRIPRPLIIQTLHQDCILRGLKKDLHAQASNERPITREIPKTWFDKLYVWCDTQPRKHPEIVKQFPPIPVAGTKRCLRKRTEFVAGTRIESAQAEGIALVLSI